MRSPRRRPRLLATTALIALATAWGCAGSSFDGTLYRGQGMAFRVGPIPESWRAIDVSEALLAFRDDTSHATVAVNGRCGRDGDDVPLESLTRHLFLEFTEREVLTQERLQMDGREAMRTELSARLDGVEKRFTVYVLKKDGCVYDFMHIADQRHAEQSQASFDRFVRGFATESQP